MVLAVPLRVGEAVTGSLVIIAIAIPMMMKAAPSLAEAMASERFPTAG